MFTWSIYIYTPKYDYMIYLYIHQSMLWFEKKSNTGEKENSMNDQNLTLLNQDKRQHLPKY